MLNLGTFEKDHKTGKLTGVLYDVNMYPTKLIFEPETSSGGNQPCKVKITLRGFFMEILYER
jgi:hypothetical protein